VMAERRMFAKTIIDSDAFIDMPATARLLYYDLAKRADDDGFVNSPKKIMAFVGAKMDDLNILALRKFIIPFDNGVVVIKHWRIHNYIRKDTYNETSYKEQKALLEFDENNAYRLIDESRQRVVDGSSTQDSIGKDRLIKENTLKSIKEKTETTRFKPPTVDEVRAYCSERKNNVDAETFVDFYTAKGWKVGNNPMKDWKAAVRTWEKRDAPAKKDFDITDPNNYKDVRW
jgi:hypothetical protein